MFTLVIFVAVSIALLTAVYNYIKVKRRDAGTDEMKEIALAIQEGSNAFIAHEYRIILINDYVVIGADTIVSVEEYILGKPKDKDEAFAMIKKLSGRWHEVITGICIFDNEKLLLEHEITRVHFVKMSDDEIQNYVDTDEPYDKAGAYGVQGQAGVYIDSIEGDYYNIMGFPMAKVRNMLKSIWVIDGVKG